MTRDSIAASVPGVSKGLSDADLMKLAQRRIAENQKGRR